MTSVQNHRRPLNGNKLLIALIALICVFDACAPKVLRPGGSRPSTEEPKDDRKRPEETDEPETSTKPEASFNAIALLLPFQLDKVNGPYPGKADVERSALALDFYQGFRMGLNQVSGNDINFKLDVLDSKDNAVEARNLATSEVVRQAGLVVGPIFPSEIEAFSQQASLGKKLQISPLAASNPNRYQLDNLVTVTPPIEVHAQALANYLNDNKEISDRILILNLGDADGDKFLNPLKQALSKLRISFDELRDAEELASSVAIASRNFVIVGSTNTYAIMPVVERLYSMKTEEQYDIQLWGHPNWTRAKLDGNFLSGLETRITTSYYINERMPDVARFRQGYKRAFNVEPTEFSFKGFDTGLFFGKLLAEYPDSYAEELVKENYQGNSIGFRFQFDKSSGYVNHAISVLKFDGKSYIPDSSGMR